MKLSPFSLIIRSGAIAAAALFVAGCDRPRTDSAWWSDENERISLSHQLELKRFRFEQVAASDFPELEKLRASTHKAASDLTELRKRRTLLAGTVTSMEADRDTYRRSLIAGQRQRAMRRTFDEFALNSGRVFKGVSISAIDDAGVTIRHTDGSARLRFADLDAGQRLLFGLEEDLAMVAEKQEREDAVAYERWIDTQMAEIRVKEEQLASVARREKSNEERARRTSAAAARNLVAANTSPLAQPARTFSSRSWGGYSTYRAYRPTYRYVYYTPSSYSRNSHTVLGPVRQVTGGCYTPPVTTPRRSFANTTISTIP
jgi:hypothetical protein